MRKTDIWAAVLHSPDFWHEMAAPHAAAGRGARGANDQGSRRLSKVPASRVREKNAKLSCAVAWLRYVAKCTPVRIRRTDHGLRGGLILEAPQKVSAQRMRLWHALHDFCRQHGGTVVPYRATKKCGSRFRRSSPLPAKLVELGYDVRTIAASPRASQPVPLRDRRCDLDHDAGEMIGTSQNFGLRRQDRAQHFRLPNINFAETSS